MAHRGNAPRDPHLQVGSRLNQSLWRSGFKRPASFILILALFFAAPTAEAATKKPSPKATVKVTAKASSKPTVKPTAKLTTKATSQNSTSPTGEVTG